MSTADLQNTSQMAIKLWTGRDAAYAQGDSTTANSRPRRNSFGSAYSHTVLGTGTGNRVGAAAAEVDHGMTCDGCAQVSIPQGPSSARANNIPAPAYHRHPLSVRKLPLLSEAREPGAFSPDEPSAYGGGADDATQCERCEARSYALHDPWHVFFKLPRLVDRALVLQPPLPRLYAARIGTRTHLTLLL